jgi:hypothetical protein
MAPLDNMEPQIQETLGLCKQLQRIVANTTMSLYHEEFQELEDLITKIKDIFTRKTEDYGQINRVYHCYQHRQYPTDLSPPRLPLA